MEDLSHWDEEEEFSPLQAAALIAGFDPDKLGDVVPPRVGRRLVRLSEGHRQARVAICRVEPMTSTQFTVWRKSCEDPDALVSVLFDQYVWRQKAAWPGDPHRIYEVPNFFQGNDGNFDRQTFMRAEIHRWLGAVGLKTSYTFECQQECVLPPSPSLVEEVSGPVADSGGVKPAPTGWKMEVQIAATLHWKKLRTAGGNPTVSSIVDSMAKWCRENNVLTDSGINPSANYLRTHVLGGKHWTSPR